VDLKKNCTEYTQGKVDSDKVEIKYCRSSPAPGKLPTASVPENLNSSTCTRAWTGQQADVSAAIACLDGESLVQGTIAKARVV